MPSLVKFERLCKVPNLILCQYCSSNLLYFGSKLHSFFFVVFFSRYYYVMWLLPLFICASFFVICDVWNIQNQTHVMYETLWVVRCAGCSTSGKNIKFCMKIFLFVFAQAIYHQWQSVVVILKEGTKGETTNSKKKNNKKESTTSKESCWIRAGLYPSHMWCSLFREFSDFVFCIQIINSRDVARLKNCRYIHHPAFNPFIIKWVRGYFMLRRF